MFVSSFQGSIQNASEIVLCGPEIRRWYCFPDIWYAHRQGNLKIPSLY